MTDKQRLNLAFKELRKQGFVARQRFMCCQGCGWAAIANDKPDATHVAFYHQQDADAIDEDGKITEPMYIAWAGDALAITTALTNAGLKAEWDGSADTRVCVKPRDK